MPKSRRATPPEDGALTYDCFLCGRKFQFSKGRYDGLYIRAWEIMVCRACHAGNWDGIVPSTYPHLIKHLREKGVDTPLNGRGWIPWPQ